jgi:hypothetical protein
VCIQEVSFHKVVFANISYGIVDTLFYKNKIISHPICSLIWENPNSNRDYFEGKSIQLLKILI